MNAAAAEGDQLQTARTKSRQLLHAAGVGQLCAFLVAVTGASSTALSRQGISLPTTQNAINYFLLTVIYGSVLWKSGKRRLTNQWYKYAGLSLLDVEANYLVVLAFRFTSITSVTLLDCFSIPTAILLSWILLAARYKLSHCIGAALCVTGLVVLVLTESPDAATSGSRPLLGDALVLVGATMYGTCNVVEEKFLGDAGRTEVLAVWGACGLAISSVQAVLLEGRQILAAPWTWQAGWLLAAYSCALVCFSSLVPYVLLWSGAAALNLSLLTSDLWAGLSRLLLFGGFETRQAVSFVAALVLTATGLVIFTVSGDAYADTHAKGFHPLQEVSAAPMAVSSELSGELKYSARTRSRSASAESIEPLADGREQAALNGM